MIRERHKALVTAIDTYAAADQIEQLRNALAAGIAVPRACMRACARAFMC